MKGLSKIGSAAHAPFIAGAAPQMMGMQSWQELANPRDLAKQFDSIDYMAWRSFRDSNDSRYMALTLPRFLGRPLYGANSEPVEEFAFEEQTEGGQHDNYLWLNASYALGVRLTEAFKTYGWCTRIRGVESGGTVEGLPTALFPTDDGSMDAKCPTEIAISDRREAELSKAGLMALVHRKNTDQATFIGAQTLHAPKAYEDKDATASANLSARLPYIFASCRFAHYLKCMVRDWVGSTREAPATGLRPAVLDHAVRRHAARLLHRGGQGPQAAETGFGRRDPRSREPRLLPRRLPDGPTLSARGHGCVPEHGLPAAQGRQLISSQGVNSKQHREGEHQWP